MSWVTLDYEDPHNPAPDLFNADWAAAAVFDVNEEFSYRFDQGLLIAMHKTGKADAYVVFLFDDYAEVKSSIKENMVALRFAN